MTEDTQVEREAALASLGAPCKLLSSHTRQFCGLENCSCDVCALLILGYRHNQQWRVL